MSSSNGFNVCPRCGKANALNARYCSSCGQQLAVPQEVIVCHKCHKTNSPMASFCGACGAPLRIGAQTKICPRCHKEVDANESSCSCGYSFGNVKYAVPESAASVAVDTSSTKRKGGRAVAIVSLVLLLLFAYLIFASAFGYTMNANNELVQVPTNWRPKFLYSFDGGLVHSGSENSEMYGLEFLAVLITLFISDVATAIDVFVGAYGIGGLILTILLVITAITAVIQLITYIVRICANTKNKRKNLFYLIMAIVATLWVGLAFLFRFVSVAENSFFAKVANVFTVSGCEIGYIAILLPVYFWLFFFISLGNRSKKAKEDVA